jgi:hypothetical protein
MRALIFLLLCYLPIAQAMPTTGVWTAYPKQDELRMSLEADKPHMFRSQFPIAYTDLDGLAKNDFGGMKKVSFVLAAESGRVVFHGNTDGMQAGGTYDFEADGRYAAALEQRGIEGFDDRECFGATIHNVSLAFIDEIQAAGFKPRDFGTYLAFAIHGVNRAFIESFANMGYKLDEDDALSFAVHNVTPERIDFLNEQFGQRLKTNDIMAAVIHRLTPEFIAGFQAIGYEVSIDEALALQIHGVSPQIVMDFQEWGVVDEDIETYVAFSIHGVREEYVASLHERGFTQISNGDLLAMRIHGVTTSYIDALAEAGITEIDSGELIAFAVHGVTPEFVAERREKGKSIDPGRVIESRIFCCER